MDNLAHSLCGLALGECGPRKAYGARASWLMVAAANLPDTDALIRVAGYDTYVFHHRGFTHGIAGILAGAAALAVAWRARDPEARWRPWFLLALAGLVSHVLMDWTTSWGTMFLYPFSRERFALDWVAIVDPWVWGILAGGLGLGWILSARREAVNRAALGLLLAYHGLCAASHALAQAQFREALARIRVRPDTVEAFPQFLSPLSWNAVAPGRDRTFQARVHALRGLEGRINVWFQADAPWARQAPFVTTYAWWARAPVLRLVAGAGTPGHPAPPELVLFDLRFMNALAGLPFAVHLDPVAGGGVTRRWYAWGELAPPLPDQEYELP